MGDVTSSVRALAYMPPGVHNGIMTSSAKCLSPQTADVQGESPAPPEAASVMTEWMSLTPVPAKHKTASCERKATLAKHHGGKENMQLPRPRPLTARVEKGIARRGIYQATASLGAPPRGGTGPASPPLWRSANAGLTTTRPAASDPVVSPGPTAPRQPTATPTPLAAFATWSQLFEACRKFEKWLI